MKKRIVFLLTFVFFLYFPITYAIILQPPSITYDFVPGAEYFFSFKVQGSKNEEVQDVYVYVVGDLNKTITISPITAKIEPGIWTEFTGTIKIPNTLEPGTHTNRITVVQGAPETAGVGSVAGVELLLGVKVPYPGKYADISLVADNIKLGQKQNFLISVISLGKENLETVYGDIVVFDSRDIIVGSVKTNTISILSGNVGKINAIWDSSNSPQGEYYAEAKVNYDGRLEEDQKRFSIGDLLMDITNINSTRIKKGEVGKVYVTAQSFWNDPILGVYTQLDFTDRQNQQFTFRSQEDTFEGFSIRNLLVYVDSANIEQGTYNAQYTLFYSNKTVVRQSTITISPGSFVSGLSLTQILLILIILILLILVLVNIKKYKKQSKNINNKQ